jgi:type II secretory pathway pseudopilin PulG
VCRQYSETLAAKLMLIQLLIVIALSAIPAALLLPPLSMAKSRAGRVHFLAH